MSSSDLCLRRFAHPAVRIPRKSTLEGAGDGICKAREGMAWAGDGFQLVPDISGGGVALDEEALVALLDVHLSGGIDESEVGFGVDCLRDAAEIQRPESHRPYFDSHNLAGYDLRLGIGDAGPAEIEGSPLREGSFSRGKCGLALIVALANSRASAVMDKTGWKLSRDESVRHGEELRRVGGQGLRGSNPVLDCCRCGLFQAEHSFIISVLPACLWLFS